MTFYRAGATRIEFARLSVSRLSQEKITDSATRCTTSLLCAVQFAIRAVLQAQRWERA